MTAMSNRPSPGEVEFELRPIWEMVRARCRLDSEQCATLAKRFVHANLVHWASHMNPPLKKGKSALTGCPVNARTNCKEAQVKGPPHVMTRDGDDFCPQRSLKHPWALQVSLLWNSSHTPADRPPDRACALKVYQKIVDNSQVHQQWPGIASLERSPDILAQWERIADTLEHALASMGDQPPERLREYLEGTIDSKLVARMVSLVNDALYRWTWTRGMARREKAVAVKRAVQALAGPMILHLRCGWAFPTRRYGDQVHRFLEVLRDLAAPDRSDIEAMLQEESVVPSCQRVILEYMARTVWRLTTTGLSPRDSLNERPVQDLFWDRVGSEPRPDANAPFELYAWCWKRYGDRVA